MAPAPPIPRAIPIKGQISTPKANEKTSKTDCNSTEIALNEGDIPLNSGVEPLRPDERGD